MNSFNKYNTLIKLFETNLINVKINKTKVPSPKYY